MGSAGQPPATGPLLVVIAAVTIVVSPVPRVPGRTCTFTAA
jgi:hypothetical protein